MKLTEFDQRTICRKTNGKILINKIGEDIIQQITPFLQKEGEHIAIIDARTLVDKNDLRNQLNQVKDGYLIFNHATEVPQGEHRDIIVSMICACLKGDLRNAGETITFAEDWMNHLAQCSIGVLAIVEENEEKTSSCKSLSIRTSAAYLRIGNNGIIRQ